MLPLPAAVFFRITALIPVFFIIACPAWAQDENTGSTGRAPNLLVILTDDQGYGDVAAYGASDLLTPSIDRLALEGMRFTTVRANATVCSPTRAAMLTGRYADRVGVPGVIRTQPGSSWGYLDPKVPTLADHLREVGYHTALVGKWHLGLESPNTPNERGFDLFQGFLGDMMDDYWRHTRHGRNYMRLNDQVIQPEGHATDLFTDWAIDYLRQRAAEPETPFFLFLAYNAPHFPIQPPEEWLSRVRARSPELEDGRALNVAFVEHMDAGIGRLLDAMEELGLADDTMVVFTSDNGGSLPHHQSNLPWRDGKQSHYEGGLRVPFIVRWPAGVEAESVTDHPGLTFDIFPTFLELAGADLPGDLDAVSLLPVLRGAEGGEVAAAAEAREFYFVRREGGLRHGGNSYEALIRGPWKLLRNSPVDDYELYHLGEDPLETTDVIDQHPRVARELREALMRHIQRGGVAPWQPPGT